MDAMKKRMFRALGTVIIACVVGTVGFYLLDDGQHTVSECFFMTVITLATVGYREVIPLDMYGQLFASMLIIFGMGTLIYFGSTLIAFWVELDLRHARRRKKMKKRIDHMKGHIIVCGTGTTGGRVIDEMIDTKTPFVMVDIDEDKLLALHEKNEERAPDLCFVHGDATEDKVLEAAGIDRAAGLVAVLRSDKDNLYLILSARQIKPDLRIVARATEEDAPAKMLRAGANKVIAPNILGGMRIASEIIRPDVVEFLDIMLRDKKQNTRIEQVVLPLGSPLAGKKLSDTKIRKATDVLVIALRTDEEFIYNPGPDTIITDGAVLVVLGSVESVVKLRESLKGQKGAPHLIDRAPAPVSADANK
jgi:voltage-gated potassium channel